MEKTFEQKINDAVSNAVGLPSAMIDYYDAIKIAREADAALAARQRENISIKKVMVEQAHKNERLTDINAAKGELIDFYTNYLSSISGYLATHQMSPSEAQVEYGNRLRARIRSLESE